MGFQTTVNAQPAPAVAGDFASQNPRANVLAAAGQLVAPVGGLTVGNFCFVNPADGTVSATYVSGYQIGFLARNEQGLITRFLGESSMLVPAGFMVVLFDQGEFYARFSNGATVGQSVYADEGSGAPVSGSATTSVTAIAGATGTLTTVSGSSTVTVNTVTAGSITVGDFIASANVPAGAQIFSQISGAAGGAGVYSLTANASASAGPTAFTDTSNTLNVTAISAGALGVGDTLTGTGVTAGTKITGLGTGSGGVGTYIIAPAQQFASGTVTTVLGNIITNYKVRSAALAGELAIISTWGV